MSSSATKSRKRKRKEKSPIKLEGEEEEPMSDRGESSTSGANRNPKGKNQWGEPPPLDDKLASVFKEIHHRNVRSTDKFITELANQGYSMRKTKFFEYKKILGLTGPRSSSLNDTETTQAVLTELEEDINQTKGPRKIWEELGFRGIHLPRDKVAQVMQDHQPEGFAQRAPGRKIIHRTPLHSLGPDEEWSMDGHDKLAKAGFGIYGIRDKFSGKYLYYRVLPSNRYAAVIGMVFLECILLLGRTCIQGSTDHGSEIRDSMAIQSLFREMFGGELLESLIASWRTVESFRNITVERGWQPLFEQWGVNVLTFHDAGLFGGVYEVGNDLHRNLKNWIWFPLIQASLDEFVFKQNHHRIRKQAEKVLPSGGSSSEFYQYPDRYGGEQCGIPVDKKVVQSLLDNLRVDNGHLMEYVAADFQELADAAYAAIGKPKIALASAWKVFEAMVHSMVV